jgi:purine-binding chemotaxis protein CheW
MADLSALRLLLFRIADLVCATEVTTVREILERQPATRIPGAAPAVEGLINVRGELLTLVDGTRLLGRAGSGTIGATLLIGVGRHTVGMIVDRVLDLITVPREALSAREELPGVDPRLVRAVGRREGEAFLLLDLDALLDPILSH